MGCGSRSKLCGDTIGNDSGVSAISIIPRRKTSAATLDSTDGWRLAAIGIAHQVDATSDVTVWSAECAGGSTGELSLLDQAVSILREQDPPTLVSYSEFGQSLVRSRAQSLAGEHPKSSINMRVAMLRGDLRTVVLDRDRWASVVDAVEHELDAHVRVGSNEIALWEELVGDRFDDGTRAGLQNLAELKAETMLSVYSTSLPG